MYCPTNPPVQSADKRLCVPAPRPAVLVRGTRCTYRDSAGELTIAEHSTKELRGDGTQTLPVYSWIAVPVLPSGTDAGPRTASSGARPDLPWVTRGRCGAARGPAVGSRVCQHGSVDRGVSAPVSAAGGGVAKFVRGRHVPSAPLCGVCRGHLFSVTKKITGGCAHSPVRWVGVLEEEMGFTFLRRFQCGRELLLNKDSGISECPFGAPYP